MLCWCDLNGLSVNIKKCCVLSFCRKRTVEMYDYNLNGRPLERVSNFCDLGVWFDTKLCFNRHIDITTRKASSCLGMIKRWSKEFDDPYVTKSLYVCFVRSILEYGCQVWSPYYQCHIDRLESVQRQFLLFALKNLNWNDRLHLPKYEHRLLLLDLNTLKDRRTILNVTFIFKLINGSVNCNYLLSKLKFNCPFRSSRSYKPLIVSNHIRTYLNNEPLNNLCNNFNNMYFLFDFNLSIESFKLIICKYFKSQMQLCN